MATNGEPLVCGLDGNPDLTGLGIRAAFYIQTLSFAIAGEFLDAEAGYLHSSAIGLLLAVFVALLRETVSGSLSAPEVAVVMWLFSLQLFASGRTVRKTVPDGEKRVSTAAFLTLRLHILLVLAYIGYATWFWFVGLDVLPHTACTEWAFFFSKVDVRGWFRTLSKVVMGMVCSICGLWVLIMLTIWTFVLLKKVIRHIRGIPQTQKAVVLGFTQSDEQFPETVAFFFPEGRSNLQDATRHFSQPKKITLSSTYMLLAAVRGGIFLALITIAVELPIQWNEIRNVQSLGSVSQLVPFIVALGQFIHVAYTTIRGKDSINYANWIRNAADPRLWKEVKETVTPSPCPKRGCYQLDEEQHEMIVAAEGAPAQEEVASRESVDSTLGVEGLHGPASYGNPIESLRSSDIYLAQIGSPPRVVQ